MRYTITKPEPQEFPIHVSLRIVKYWGNKNGVDILVNGHPVVYLAQDGTVNVLHKNVKEVL